MACWEFTWSCSYLNVRQDINLIINVNCIVSLKNIMILEIGFYNCDVWKL